MVWFNAGGKGGREEYGRVGAKEEEVGVAESIKQNAVQRGGAIEHQDDKCQILK